MVRTTVALLACAGVATACMPEDPEPPTATTTPPTTTDGPGTLRWGLGADPTSLDPAAIVRDGDALVVDALFDSLTRLGPDFRAAPALAADWRSNSNATSFTFDLDPDAQWHDGTRVVAADVVRGLQRVADGTREQPSLHAHLLRDLEGFTAAQVGQPLRGAVAVDDRTLRIDVSEPVPELPEILAHPALAPVPPAAVDDASRFGESPVGNGPFELAEPWAHNQFLRLAPSATHPRPDNVQEVVFRIYASDDDGATRHADVLEGQIHVSELPPALRLEAADTVTDGEVELFDGLTDTVSMLLFDTRQPLMDDERFRRAVSLLVDRERLAARTDGAREPATSLVPPVLPGGRAAVCAWCRHDPETAGELVRQVLAEREAAELGPPPPIVLQTSTDALHGALADELAAELRALGFLVRIVRAEEATYLDAATEEQPGVIRLAWAAEEPTMRAWTERLFGPGSRGAALTGWQPGSLRDLLANAEASSDRVTRQRLWQQVERLALDAAVVAPVLHYRDDLLVNHRVSGLRPDPFGNVDLAAVAVAAAGAAE